VAWDGGSHGGFPGSTKPLEGVTWKGFVESALMEAGLDKGEAGRGATFYIDVRKGLHRDVFYGRWYEEGRRPLMEGARDYLKLVESLL